MATVQFSQHGSNMGLPDWQQGFLGQAHAAGGHWLKKSLLSWLVGAVEPSTAGGVLLQGWPMSHFEVCRAWVVHATDLACYWWWQAVFFNLHGMIEAHNQNAWSTSLQHKQCWLWSRSRAHPGWCCGAPVGAMPKLWCACAVHAPKPQPQCTCWGVIRAAEFVCLLDLCHRPATTTAKRKGQEGGVFERLHFATDVSLCGNCRCSRFYHNECLYEMSWARDNFMSVSHIDDNDDTIKCFAWHGTVILAAAAAAAAAAARWKCRMRLGRNVEAGSPASTLVVFTQCELCKDWLTMQKHSSWMPLATWLWMECAIVSTHDHSVGFKAVLCF